MRIGVRKPSLSKRINARTSIKNKWYIELESKCLEDMVGSAILRNLCTTRYITEPPLTYLRYLRSYSSKE